MIIDNEIKDLFNGLTLRRHGMKFNQLSIKQMEQFIKVMLGCKPKVYKFKFVRSLYIAR